MAVGAFGLRQSSEISFAQGSRGRKFLFVKNLCAIFMLFSLLAGCGSSPQMAASPVSVGCLEGPDGSSFAGRLDDRYGAPDPLTRWNNPTLRELRIERVTVSNGRVRVMGTRQSIERQQTAR